MGSHIYFAGESLACLADTKALALRHHLIWRPPARFPAALPGERLLFTFWRGRLAEPTSGFIPLLMCRLRFPIRVEQAADLQSYMGIIPAAIRDDFLHAARGLDGTGYRQADNSSFAAICVDIEADLAAEQDDLDEDTSAQLYGYNRGAAGRKAWWHFNCARLRGRLLPSSLYP